MRYPEELANSAPEDATEPANSLPKSELNPLINPVLGRNLGRWAHAYFTSPPEKREEAVEELLRELEGEVAGGQAAISPPRTQEKAQPSPIEAIAQQQLCPGCKCSNQRGQRFCGYCGLALNPEAERDYPDYPQGREQLRDSRIQVSDNEELEWLRDKALSGFEKSQAPARRGLRYLVVGVLILVAAFGYLQWASWSPARSPIQPSAVSSSPSGSSRSPAQVNDVSKPNPLQHQEPIAASRAVPGADEFRNKLSETGSSLKPSQQAKGPEPTNSEADAAGTDELAAAQRYLEGKYGARDSSQAAKWLWKAVQKQNPTAALMLAELYSRGDGVPKNCDQARLLLVAAAKRGAPDAGLRLRNLESSGCQ